MFDFLNLNNGNDDDYKEGKCELNLIDYVYHQRLVVWCRCENGMRSDVWTYINTHVERIRNNPQHTLDSVAGDIKRHH